MSFANRSAAGRQLAPLLMRYRGEDPVVLALPRGGVPVAAEVAMALEAPLDLLFVRKIGVPWQPELAMGAVGDGAAPLIVRNPDVITATGVGEAAFAVVVRREVVEIERRRAVYAGDRPALRVTGRTAIVVDDGVATGATIRAALQVTRAREPRRLVLAVPVAPVEALAALKTDADDIVCVEAHADFSAIGAFYDDFRQIGDREVKDLLARVRAMRPRQPREGGG